jgi:hypothetical protein
MSREREKLAKIIICMGRVARGESEGAEEVKMMLTLYAKWRERREWERREGRGGGRGGKAGRREGREGGKAGGAGKGARGISASERDGGERIEALTETGNEGEPLEEWKEGTEIRPQIYN